MPIQSQPESHISNQYIQSLTTILMNIKTKKNWIFILSVCVTTCIYITLTLNPSLSASERSQSQLNSAVPLWNNLGNIHHKITTNSPQAQRYFDQGLTFIFGFNHAEAKRSFQQAIQLDSDCAMCYWGMALSEGPNINAPMNKESIPTAYQAIQKAQKLSTKTTPIEQVYIEALSQRYSPQNLENRQPLDMAYANAMRELFQQYPNDLDAATLFAESLMDLMPWNYWQENGEPQPLTNEVVKTLEFVLEKKPNHPGAIHYYIHALEASPYPEKAEKAADRLRNLVPASGHLVHMPSHLYLRIGRYHDAASANQNAIKADEKFLATSQQKGLYSALYYPHNIHFFWSAASMEGRSEDAINAARKLVDKVSLQEVKQIPFSEIFLPTPYFSLVQFGKWDEILTESQPSNDFPYTMAMWHYARGIAWVGKGSLENAQFEYQKIKDLLQNSEISSLETVNVPATNLISIANHLLVAKMADLKDKNEEMISEYQAAVKIQDNLPYTEPPYWYYPVRLSLGAALLRLNRKQEAEAVYRQDLQQHPNNGWSLYGLAESLSAQGKQKEAEEVKQEFKKAWLEADIKLTTSEF
ncbi:MAG: tetratricopeptide repeat protein [Trichodesmium sp. St5_bin2_1]|nr:tetratricopeptide repeat protein [Trichodesmium sp. St5_bin2_1]